jgi:hypothetical protein
MGLVGALHSLRSFRRRLPWALGNTKFQVQLAIGFHLFRQHSREQFFIPKPLQAHHRPSVCTGPALSCSLRCHGAHVQGSSLRSVLRQPALAPAAPKCHTPSPCWLSVLRRPASGFAPWQATAQASRSHGWHRRCLASSPSPVTVVTSLLASLQTFRLAHAFEHPVQARRSVPQHSCASNTASA